MSSSSPGSPSRAKPGALRRAEARAALPSPPRPPWAATYVVPAPTRSASTSPVDTRLTTVPLGTASTRSCPSAPLRWPPCPGLPLVAGPVRGVVVVEQGRRARVDPEQDVAAAAAVAAVRPAQRLELLAVHRAAPVPAVAAGDVQDHAVHEGGHGRLDSVSVKQRGDRGRGRVPISCRDPVCRTPVVSAGGVGQLGRDDVDDPTTPAAAELDGTGDEREQRVVTAAADVEAGVEVGAALADDDLAGVDEPGRRSA